VLPIVTKTHKIYHEKLTKPTKRKQRQNDAVQNVEHVSLPMFCVAGAGKTDRHKSSVTRYGGVERGAAVSGVRDIIRNWNH